MYDVCKKNNSMWNILTIWRKISDNSFWWFFAILNDIFCWPLVCDLYVQYLKDCLSTSARSVISSDVWMLFSLRFVALYALLSCYESAVSLPYPTMSSPCCLQRCCMSRVLLGKSIESISKLNWFAMASQSYSFPFCIISVTYRLTAIVIWTCIPSLIGFLSRFHFHSSSDLSALYLLAIKSILQVTKSNPQNSHNCRQIAVLHLQLIYAQSLGCSESNLFLLWWIVHHQLRFCCMIALCHKVVVLFVIIVIVAWLKHLCSRSGSVLVIHCIFVAFVCCWSGLFVDVLFTYLLFVHSDVAADSVL